MLSVTTSEPEEKGGENEKTQSSSVTTSEPEDKGEEKVLERLNSITQAHKHTHTPLSGSARLLQFLCGHWVRLSRVICSHCWIIKCCN